MKNNILKTLALPASKLIRRMAVFSANSASPYGMYQPIEPKEVKKLKK